jgi:hypothetical protein
MPTKAHYTLYCDETGNTGSRFLDPDQPLFAEGGWFVATNNHPRAVAAIENLERNFKTGTNELKGAKIAKTAKGQAFIRSVCAAVGKNGGVPFLYLVEKRYFVCTKIVETFFDPLYNPAISVSETWDPEKRQSDAQFFYDNGGILIDEFAEAYRIKDPMAVRANAEKWAEHLTKHGKTEQAARVAGVLPQIEDEIATEKEHSTSGALPSGMDSLNLPIVAEVFQFAEQQCPRSCDIIHDQTSSFEPVYRYVFSKFAAAKPSAAQMKDGRQLRIGFRNVLSLSFVDSETEPLIRAADYSLAGTRKFIELATSNRKIPQDLTWSALGMLGSLLAGVYLAAHPSLGSMPELTRVMSSNAWITKIVMRLHDEMKPLIK